jgi:hypothetical protein
MNALERISSGVSLLAMPRKSGRDETTIRRYETLWLDEILINPVLGNATRARNRRMADQRPAWAAPSSVTFSDFKFSLTEVFSGPNASLSTTVQRIIDDEKPKETPLAIPSALAAGVGPEEPPRPEIVPTGLPSSILLTEVVRASSTVLPFWNLCASNSMDICARGICFTAHDRSTGCLHRGLPAGGQLDEGKELREGSIERNRAHACNLVHHWRIEVSSGASCRGRFAMRRCSCRASYGWEELLNPPPPRPREVPPTCPLSMSSLNALQSHAPAEYPESDCRHGATVDPDSWRRGVGRGIPPEHLELHYRVRETRKKLPAAACSCLCGCMASPLVRTLSSAGVIHACVSCLAATMRTRLASPRCRLSSFSILCAACALDLLSNMIVCQLVCPILASRSAACVLTCCSLHVRYVSPCEVDWEANLFHTSPPALGSMRVEDGTHGLDCGCRRGLPRR